MKREGQVNVHSENIFPVIRQWLYADRDIFLRELVANAQDALMKLDRLEQMGQLKSVEPYQGVQVIWNEDERILTIEDDGIGMTLEEIDRYINDIAYSGALDFVHQYEEHGEAGEGIIGHFGLGFYSAFMVSDHVQIDSLSYQDGSTPARWSSEDGLHYVMETPENDDPLTRTSRGTSMRLTISEGEEITLEYLRSILKKYCYFMQKPIYLLTSDQSIEDQEMINNPKPLWLKNPNQVTEEEYKAFYHEIFEDPRDPMFWIHLNMDYPYRLQGILYFPTKELQIEKLDGRIKLYCNQVFVSDSLRDLIPEFLFLLKGALDCPDLPLNVSRSYLQDDRVLGRLSDHIVRKVSDKLNGLVKSEREFYEESWPALERFARYGYLTEEKFANRMDPAMLFKTVDDDYLSFSELDEEVYYTTNPATQLAYIERQKMRGAQIIVMPDEMDQALMQQMSFKREGKVRFFRVDAKIDGEIGDRSQQLKFETFFRSLLDDEHVKVETRALGNELPIYILEDEQSRSFREMQKHYAAMNPEMANLDLPKDQTVVVNTDHDLIKKIADKLEADASQEVESIGKELIDLALLAKGELGAEDLTAFVRRTAKYLAGLV